MNIKNIIDDAVYDSLNSEPSELVSLIKKGESSFYVIGKNAQSSEIIKNFNPIGLIDDYSNSEKNWNGTPIVKLKDVHKSSIVINCSTSISPILVRNNLLAAGLDKIISVSELISRKVNLLSEPWFVSQQHKELAQYSSYWSDIYQILSDEISKQTLLDVLRFRLTADCKYMNNYSVRLREQYFENFMQYENEYFVDAGGYDGDTTEEFVLRYPDYKKIYFFEPSIKNLSAARAKLIGRRDIHFSAMGLSNRRGMLNFNSDAGSASAITEDSMESIHVDSLDTLLHNQPVSFIKMDLEGWEINALHGAKEIIKKYKPKLAVAVYHEAKDIREIPGFILSLNSDYKVYLRHYTQGWSETVMYFK